MLSIEEIKEELVATIAPFIKGFPIDGNAPDFRKKLSGEEVEEMFDHLYSLVTRIGETV